MRIAIVLLAVAAFIQIGAVPLRGVPLYEFTSGYYSLIFWGLIAIAGVTLASFNIRAKRSIAAILLIPAACLWGAQPILYR